MVFGVYSMWFTEKKGNLNLLPEFGILENCKWSGACRKNYGFSKKRCRNGEMKLFYNIQLNLQEFLCFYLVHIVHTHPNRNVVWVDLILIYIF